MLQSTSLPTMNSRNGLGQLPLISIPSISDVVPAMQALNIQPEKKMETKIAPTQVIPMSIPSISAPEPAQTVTEKPGTAKIIRNRAAELRLKHPEKYGVNGARPNKPGYVLDGWKKAMADARKEYLETNEEYRKKSEQLEKKKLERQQSGYMEKKAKQREEKEQIAKLQKEFPNYKISRRNVTRPGYQMAPQQNSQITSQILPSPQPLPVN